MEETTKASPFMTPRSARPNEKISRKQRPVRIAPAPKAGWPSESAPNRFSLMVQFQPEKPMAKPCSVRTSTPRRLAHIRTPLRRSTGNSKRAPAQSSMNTATAPIQGRPKKAICQRPGAVAPSPNIPASQPKLRKPSSMRYHGNKTNAASASARTISSLRLCCFMDVRVPPDRGFPRNG